MARVTAALYEVDGDPALAGSTRRAEIDRYNGVSPHPGRMSPSALRQQIGQLLVGSFTGAEVPVELRAFAREFSIGGLTLFKRNVQDPEQVREVARQIEALDYELPPWVAVDQEGGRVARLKRPFTEWPPMITLGRSGSIDLAQRFARALAAELAAAGITLDFAPVLDVLTNSNNPAIGDRALADDADRVSELGRVIVTELQAGGVAACGKHFPGHGDTSVDSHHDLPVIEHPPDRLRALEFRPFRAAMTAGVASLITAHVLVPSLDDQRPATLSRRIVTAILRDELGFDGVVYTDDMEMKAIAARWAVPDACVEAIDAGCDAVLICSGNVDLQAAAAEALIRAVENERLSWSRIEDSLARHRRMKERFFAARGSQPPATRQWRTVLGQESHLAIAAEMEQFL
ncbi:MAG TPA: beta-N-acetylhexosaminidase [Vicinamibacterales bacterium]|nr:beta-N-acetylhexosaminidase [Vicinamibacterales bacterium]